MALIGHRPKTVSSLWLVASMETTRLLAGIMLSFIDRKRSRAHRKHARGSPTAIIRGQKAACLKI